MGDLHRPVRRQSRQQAQRDAEQGQRAARAGRVRPVPGRCCSARPPSNPALPARRRSTRANCSAGVSDRGPAQPAGQHQHLLTRHPGGLRAHLHDQLPARAVEEHRGRHPLRRHARRRISGPRELQRDPTSSRTGSIDEFGSRWRTCRPTSPPAGRRATFAYTARARHVAAADLSRLLQRRRATRTTPAAYSGANWTNATFVGRLAATTRTRATRPSDLDGKRRGAPTRSRPACRRTSSWSIRPSTSDNVYHSNAFSGYDALQIELRRRLSRGFQINGSYQYALEGGSSFLGRHYGRVIESDRQRPPRHQDAVGLEHPGRPRPPVRHRHEPAARRRARRLGIQRRRPHPGADPQFRQRPAGRDDGRRADEAYKFRDPSEPDNPARRR